jgi:hypothetical protein
MSQPALFKTVQTSHRGRSLELTGDSTIGQPIYRNSQAFISVLNPEELDQRCSYCYKSKNDHFDPIDPKFCTQCHTLCFCSQTCQIKAWGAFHKWECKILKKQSEKRSSELFRALVRILTMKKDMHAELWSQFLSLQESLASKQKPLTIKQAEAICVSVFHALPPSYQKQFTPKDICSYYFRILRNSFHLMQPDFESIGLALDLKIALINHSCLPNAYVMTDGENVSLFPYKNLSKGEELLISYCDTTSPISIRQETLSGQYFFTCTCDLCKQATNSITDQFTGPYSAADRSLRELVEPRARIFRELLRGVDTPDQFELLGPDSPELVALEDHFRQLYQKASQEPDRKKQQKAYEALCKQLATSKIWPLHRYPFADARLDLAVLYASQEEHEQAVIQWATLIDQIVPVQYPVEWHPIRVVRRVVFLKTLQWYLLDRKNTIIDDMGVLAIIFQLGLGLDTLVAKSHGKDSTFYKSVKVSLEQTLDTINTLDPNTDPARRVAKAKASMKLLVDANPF